jgi:hypothetical protein
MCRLQDITELTSLWKHVEDIMQVLQAVHSYGQPWTARFA